jgi:hypothetical protein
MPSPPKIDGHGVKSVRPLAPQKMIGLKCIYLIIIFVIIVTHSYALAISIGQKWQRT